LIFAIKASETMKATQKKATKLRGGDFRFPMGRQKPRVFPGGTAREATAIQFPMSKNIAGVYMTLKPGGLRELHWHANAAEWGYVIEGKVRTTIVDPQGRSETNDIGHGDVWYFPRGHRHSIQGIGSGESKFLLAFDNGYFLEFATFSLTDWLAQTPRDILTQNLRVGSEDLRSLPGKEAYIVLGPTPPASPEASSDVLHSPPLTHRYELLSQEPKRYRGSSLWLASSREFPISTTMTGALLELEPGALRELHWHPNADEWQFVLSGKVRTTVFASSGRGTTVELGVGEVGVAPMGYGHSLQNNGNTSSQIILVFNNGEYQEISLSSWLSSNPAQLLETNLSLPREAIAKLPKKEEFIFG
jgi:oxalate decarboxylase